MKRKKIAIFVSGPFRYANWVRDNLAAKMTSVEHEFFFHIWKTDLGNKVRLGSQFEPMDLIKDVKTRCLLLHEPYSQAAFADPVGTDVNASGPVNVVIGMFLGICQLCQVFKTLPDRHEYTHVLRVRTDCAFIADDPLASMSFDPHTVSVSTEPWLHEGWISDHVLFASVENFLKIFAFPDIDSFYSDFLAGRRNPEKIMHHLLATKLPHLTRINKAITRYKHYHLVYSPAVKDDPPWVKDLLAQGRIDELFHCPERHRNDEQNEEVLRHLGELPKRADPFRNPAINFLRHGWHRLRRCLGE